MSSPLAARLEAWVTYAYEACSQTTNLNTIAAWLAFANTTPPVGIARFVPFTSSSHVDSCSYAQCLRMITRSTELDLRL